MGEEKHLHKTNTKVPKSNPVKFSSKTRSSPSQTRSTIYPKYYKKIPNPKKKIGQWSDVFFKLCMTPTSSTFQRKWSIVDTWVLSSWSLYTWVKSASNKFIPLTKLFSSIKIFTEVTCLISDEVCIYVTRKLTNSFFSLMLFITVKTSRRSWSSNLMVLGSEGKYELIISSFELFREIVTACNILTL